MISTSALPRPLVSVIIPSVQGARHLPECLASLAPPLARGQEIVVVDGGSCDGSRAVCARAPVPVRFVATGRNHGYAGSVNRGFAAARGQLLVVLNNDVVAAPEFLAQLVAVAEASGASLIVPRVMSLADPERIDNTGNELYADGLNLCRARGRSVRDGHARTPIAPLLPSGAAVMLRRSLVERIGGFDEAFFAFGEDAELGLRSLRAGFEPRYAPDAVVYHLGGGTWGGASLRKAFLVERNRARLAVAHLPWPALAASPAHGLARYLEHARARSDGPLGAYPGGLRRIAASLAAGAGLLAAVAGLPADLRRRARVRAQSSISERELASLLRRRAAGRPALRAREDW